MKNSTYESRINKYYEAMGNVLGYPKCCVKAFIWKRSDLQFNHEFYGTGFIPCKKCAKLDPKKLEDTINKKRKYFLPFPFHSEDVKRPEHAMRIYKEYLNKVMPYDFKESLELCLELLKH